MSRLVTVTLVAGAAVATAWPHGRRLLVGRSRRPPGQWLRRQDPRLLTGCAVAGVALLALVTGGPVAALVATAYGFAAGRALLQRAARRRAAAERARVLDDMAAFAADLRAGLVTAEPAGIPMLASVRRLADRTGAPAADLVERIEADMRATDRINASATAQAAGARVTAVLLAGLPLGGIGLGFWIGADPVHVLLRTKAGAVCAVAAVLLQIIGLLWSERLAQVTPR